MAAGDEVSLNPQPIPPGREAVYRAVSQLALSALYESDGITGSANPNSPGGPHMRDLATALAISQAATLLSDQSQRAEVQQLASKLAGEAAQQLG
ncbi:MAG: hypothetical protein QOH48_474 [Actinomycetota bacterium]|jgi:hypothetical protein|nr:hypothetical protein [Actinomycetota bacterium]